MDAKVFGFIGAVAAGVFVIAFALVSKYGAPVDAGQGGMVIGALLGAAGGGALGYSAGKSSVAGGQ